ncbi:12-oxophytodienoate reductase 1 [Phtheirospermum japonicum]|uniref:12-oxophytodienoate reductase 1 n=1 Tax=Phtheirospermum japonicum TaxID=374723 RepID=A0A830D017_9LAMI|nr:12-oxophytodienoate reductase 1 [Phtheirospermum japonicum]
MVGFLSLSLFFTELVISLLVLDFGQGCNLAYSAKLSKENVYVSAIGDPGMRSPNARFGLEAWNFCNEVGMEAPNMGSPRMADCANLYCPTITDELSSLFDDMKSSKCEVHQKVHESDNKLKAGDKFPISEFKSYTDPDMFAVEKELYLGSLCNEFDSNEPWSFWMIMLKNGNFDKNTTLCPENGKKVDKIVTNRTFPCFGEGCMNQPLVYHNESRMDDKNASLIGGFYGTYDLDAKLPESPNFKVRLTLDIKQGGGQNSQFYLLDIGSCWKNNGDPCDGDVLTDVTRYSEMIINPSTPSWCRPDNLVSCPPYHTSPTGDTIYRNDTSRFPYSAYHLYCAPGNAKYLEKPFDICDPYSNPQAQELVQILPHPEWAVNGYPGKKGDGWVGDRRTWELDTGKLSSRLYFYQDPGTKPARRVWTSINVGTEIYVSPAGVTAEWSVSDFDVLVPQVAKQGGFKYM